MEAERSPDQSPLKAFPAWQYRQIDELRRRFTLDSYKDALNFVVALIELTEDFEQQPDLLLQGHRVAVHLQVPEGGISEQVEAFAEGCEELWLTAERKVRR